MLFLEFKKKHTKLPVLSWEEYWDKFQINPDDFYLVKLYETSIPVLICKDEIVVASYYTKLIKKIAKENIR